MRKLSIILLLLGALLLSATLLRAAPTTFTIPWQVAGSGGGRSSNAGFAISGTVGQPVTAVSSGNTLNLSSGYWSKEVQGAQFFVIPASNGKTVIFSL